jgi:hypothetical protein
MYGPAPPGSIVLSRITERRVNYPPAKNPCFVTSQNHRQSANSGPRASPVSPWAQKIARLGCARSITDGLIGRVSAVLPGGTLDSRVCTT